MAVTVTKTKAAKKEILPKVDTDQIIEPGKMSIEELADLYGQLEDMVNALKSNPIFTKFAEVQEALATRLQDEYGPEEALKIKGAHWLLEIGAAAKNPATWVDKPMTQAFLGSAVFMELSKINLGDLKKYLTPEQLAKVLDEDTGYSTRRKITAKFLG